MEKNEYPYTMSFRDNGGHLPPDARRRKRVLSDAKAGRHLRERLNEHTEGTYLVKNNFDSDLFLRVVARCSAAVRGRVPM